MKPHVAARAARRPAGKLILLSALACAQAAAQAPERTSVLRYASLNGNIRGELHMLPPVSTGPMSPAWSPDGRWIAFAMAGDIWCVPATGGSAEQLTQGPWYHFEPSWSPGGSRIVMTVDTGDGLDLAVLALDGGNVTHLVEGGGVDVQPAWGPEGRFVYFATAAQGMDIHRIEVATGAREAVVAGPGNQYQPRVSAQGVLAYMAPSPGVTGSGGIWTRELQDAGGGGGADPGAPPALVRAEETAYRTRPDWLPDGSALVYVSDEAGSNDLVLIGADGGNPLRLTGGTSHELTPRVSPGGDMIAFVSNEKGPTELHVMAISGGARSSWRTIDVSERAHLEPVGRLRATVVDEYGRATPARVSVTGANGRGYAPQHGFHRVLTPTETHYFRTTGAFEVEVPPGPVTIQARKGLEYRPVTATVKVSPGNNPELSLHLERLIDARESGWYAGDTHVHDLHQGRYGLTHKDFFNDIASEDLRVAIALIHMDGTRLMGRWDDLTGRPHALSTGAHILQYAQEFRGSFGHVGLAGIEHFITPLVGGAANTPFAADLLNADYLEAVRERRTFATNGPLLFLTVDGVEPGGEIRVPEGGGGERLVVVEAASITPLQTVEIVVNGTVVDTHDAADKGERFRVESRVRADEGGWIAARALGPPSPMVADGYAFAQTSPVWIVAGDREFRSEEDVRFLLFAAEAFRARVVARDRWATDAARNRFLARVDAAIEVYRNLLR